MPPPPTGRASAAGQPVRLTRTEARRIAVRAQLLARPPADDVVGVVRHLAAVQDDPTTAVAPSAELVLWSRIGSALDPGALDDAIDEGAVVDLAGFLRPAEDVALYRAEMALWREGGPLPEWQEGSNAWVEANDECRRDILERLYDEGPLPASALPDTTLVPWRSSGWNNDRNVRMMLEVMLSRGEVARVGRAGPDRRWDLAERVYPDGPAVPLEQARLERNRRRLRALGVARARAASVPGEPQDVGEVGVPAVVDGLRGRWRVDPAQLDQPFEPRVALLSPLDRLVFDRKRMAELFDFDYQLEMYKPRERRRWGYWAMPVLAGDRLVGKVDATADRPAGLLRVDAVHEDHAWSATLRRSVHREISALARWLGLRVSGPAAPSPR